MKKIFLFSFVFLLSLLLINCGDNSKDESQNLGKDKTSKFQKRYGVKSGIIEYELSGSQEGTKTLYFDDWGMRQAEYTRSVLTVSGFSKSINIINIIDGEYQYMINADHNSGTKTRNPIIKAIEELKDQVGYNEFGEQVLLKMGAEKVGKENFLGKDCDIYAIGNTGTKLWVWEWITLKSETKSGGLDISLTAKKIDVGASIPSNKFALPERVILNEVDVDNIENEMRKENK
jgi:hypothetical protein